MDPTLTIQHLCTICPEVIAAAVISGDGAILAVHAASDHADVLGPVVTALGGMAERAIQELGRGSLELAVLTGTNGMLVLADVGRGNTLVAVAERSVRLGLLLDDVKACAASLRATTEREVARA